MFECEYTACNWKSCTFHKYFGKLNEVQRRSGVDVDVVKGIKSGMEVAIHAIQDLFIENTSRGLLLK